MDLPCSGVSVVSVFIHVVPFAVLLVLSCNRRDLRVCLCDHHTLTGITGFTDLLGSLFFLPSLRTGVPICVLVLTEDTGKFLCRFVLGFPNEDQLEFKLLDNPHKGSFHTLEHWYTTPYYRGSTQHCSHHIIFRITGHLTGITLLVSPHTSRSATRCVGEMFSVTKCDNLRCV